MTRLALGAKWSGWTMPRFLAAGRSSPALSFPLSNDPRARAPRPVVLRARKARREASVFRSSVQFMASAGNGFVEVEQDIGHRGHGREGNGIQVLGPRGLADGQPL